MKKSSIKSTLRNVFDGIMIFFFFITTTVYALPSNGVLYDNSNSGSTATTVNDALDDLYTKVDYINSIGDATAGNILSGKTAYVKGQTVTGTIPSKAATTYTPNTKDQTIAASQYLSGVQTIKGDANLVAANIAKNKTIFGVAGTYTSDADAAASNILSGKTAYVNGSKITGTIASKAATTYTPNTKDQTIAASQYLSGVQTIKGDANLKAANIKSGTTIFGIKGTYTGNNMFTYLLTMGYSQSWRDTQSWTATNASEILLIAYCSATVSVNGTAKSSAGTWAYQSIGGIYHFTMNAGDTLSVSGSGSAGQGLIAYQIG